MVIRNKFFMIFVSTCKLFVTGLEGYRVFVSTWILVLEVLTGRPHVLTHYKNIIIQKIILI